jgi:hypothetical protein
MHLYEAFAPGACVADPPTPRPGGVVIAGNLSRHKVVGIKAAIDPV